MDLFLRYNKPAPDSDKGWEEYSLPIGNGYLGVNIFGGVDSERLQITENSLSNPGCCEPVSEDLGGLTAFADIYIKFPHSDVKNYERGLCLNNAVAYTTYEYNSVTYKREYFTSYPDKVLAVKLTASKENMLDFEVCPQIPFVKDYSRKENDAGGKTGEVSASDNIIILGGLLKYYNVLYEGQVKVITDGKLTSTDKTQKVTGATEAVIIVAVGTNYKLCPEIFKTNDRLKKTLGEHPHERLTKYINDAQTKGYDAMLKDHIKDFSKYFDRVSFDLGEKDAHYMTEELLEEYKKGNRSKYLEMLYFQYGRYLLISSSRKGCLPSHLQGIWNCHEHAPWGSCYVHNINVQMNYWPAFNTNLIEMFESYSDFFSAFYEAACQYADDYIKENNPENYVEGECGYAVGPVVFPYYTSVPEHHSGPGTGGLMSKLFWEYYDFTRDEEILKNVSYKALKGMSEFLTKTVKNYDGKYYTSFSASPEQMNNGVYISNGTFYQTVGCAFDQQFNYENGRDFIKASEILGEENKSLAIQKEQIDNYDPVQIGWSGQIKEYGEEKFYGEIGEYRHRHISQLMALYPGTIINSNTDAWLDAAIYTLTQRGDNSTGWALAHRLNAWARTGDGNHAYKLICKLLSAKTNPNLWDEHPPFQIDGNFGATSGIAEMLMQSHEGYIHILPSLPDYWEDGKISGLTARGAFEVSIQWKKNAPVKVEVKSLKGNKVRIKAKFSDNVTVNEEKVNVSGSVIEFESKVNGVYVVEGFLPKACEKPITDIKVSDSLEITWQGGKCDILRAVDGAPVYECIAKDVMPPYKDDYDFSKAEIITYKAINSAGGAFTTVNHATKLELDRYNNIIKAKR